ncbi:MAG: FkbM family methyltransferase, partial [Planctomycetota bacterium]|nr:FkbM family methyltransferase [Planctomycetota bacterium]
VGFEGLLYPGRADHFIDWNVLFHGLYEADDLRLLAAVAGAYDRPVFLDVGANNGHHSLFMSAHAATVHAFEPNPGARRVLAERIDLNRLSNVVIHDCALGAADEHRRLYVSDQPEFPGASLIPGVNRTATDKFIDVRVCNGDCYLGENDITRFDLIKIDVEGFESAVLDGLRRNIERNRPVVLVEISQESRSRFGALAEFQDRFPEGYRFHVVKRASGLSISPRLVPLNEDVYRTGGNVFCVSAERAELFEACANAMS